VHHPTPPPPAPGPPGTSATVRGNGQTAGDQLAVGEPQPAQVTTSPLEGRQDRADHTVEVSAARPGHRTELVPDQSGPYEHTRPDGTAAAPVPQSQPGCLVVRETPLTGLITKRTLEVSPLLGGVGAGRRSWEKERRSVRLPPLSRWL